MTLSEPYPIFHTKLKFKISLAIFHVLVKYEMRETLSCDDDRHTDTKTKTPSVKSDMFVMFRFSRESFVIFRGPRGGDDYDDDAGWKWQVMQDKSASKLCFHLASPGVCGRQTNEEVKAYRAMLGAHIANGCRKVAKFAVKEMTSPEKIDGSARHIILNLVHGLSPCTT